MGDWVCNIIANLVSDIVLIIFGYVLLRCLARMSRRWRRLRLIDFFKLDPKQPVINFFLSRHQSTTNLPTIDTSSSTAQNPIDALERIEALQNQEEQRFQGKEQLSIEDFTTVSAEEMIEALRLNNELQKSMFFDWLPSKIREELGRNKAGSEPIEVNIDVCPTPADYNMLKDGKNNDTMVFIGGPRANLGTYYYLYGEEVGLVRPGRLKKDTIGYMDAGSELTGKEGYNLAVIQRNTKRSANRIQTIVYLAGTGVNGTVCAVAYLRKNWQKLHQKYGQKDFYVIIECPSRKKDFSDYVLKEDYHWTVLSES